MSIPQSQTRPGEVIDVRPLGPALAGAKTSSLVKTGGLQVTRLVIPRGKEIPTHSAKGEMTAHCLEGRVAFTTGGVTHELGAGQLLHLLGGQPHSVLGIDDYSALLLTIAAPCASPIEGPPSPS